jgi:hypothetical protein
MIVKPAGKLSYVLFKSLNALSAASKVLATSLFVCAVETKLVSKGEGGR